MTGMMLAAVMESHGQPLRVMRVARPEPGPGKILIRLETSGVCHTDVHIWKGDVPAEPAPDPFILGHEGVGEVVGLGEGVADWALGERAGAAWLHDTCGVCAECRGGAETFCQSSRAHGFQVPGTFAEYVVAKADHAARLPAGPAAALAPLMCAGLTALGAIETAGLKHGETCAIFGCGGLGLYAVQLAARRGARVVAVDSDPAKLDLARAMGASAVALAGPHLAETWETANRAHVSINFAPTTRTWAVMQAATRPLGRIVAAAMVAEPVPLSQEWLTWTGITVTGTAVGSRAQMSDLLRQHDAVPFTSAVETIRLNDVTEALQSLHAGQTKGRFCVAF